MDILCPSCRRVIHLEQEYPYHAGFSNQGFLYCDKDSTILLFDSYNKCFEAIVGSVHPWSLNPGQKREVEAHLKPCPCGGRFSFSNEPRCPFCGGSIQSALPSKLHYVILGSVVDGDKEDVWK